MKAKITKNETFTPIKLEITIESLDELKSLWHRFNVNFYKTESCIQANYSDEDFIPSWEVDTCEAIFTILNAYISNLEL